MADIIQFRRGTTAYWTSENPILAQGEPGIEIDGDKGRKIGDGTTAWNDLEYENTSSSSTDKNFHRKVISIVDNTSAPPTEVSGDRYILDETGGGVHADWDGASANDIVQFTDGSWVATTPVEGDKAYVDSEDKDARFVDDGTPAWELITASGGDLLAANNGSDFDDIPTVRTNLGLEIGTDVQGVLAEGPFVDGDKTKLDALTNAEPPIDETYANITALIAAQNDQLEDWLYKVTDASDHPDVTTGSATFRYLGTTLGTVADYELEWKEEDKVLTNAEVETAYNSQVDVVLQAEAEAGTSTTVRRWTAERVKQAIYALAVKLSDFLEENLNGTADEALTVTGATNVDLSAAAHRNIKLTGNATLTFTNTPASGKTITRTYKIYSAATETLTIDNSTAEYGEYVADGTENMVTVMCSNTSTEGLDVHVFFTQPN